MRKYLILLVVVLLLSALSCMEIWKDKEFLRNGMIRLHVVAQSDSYEDQQAKLLVKDAVVSFVNENVPQDIGVPEAKLYLQEHLEELETLANETLCNYDSDTSAKVTMGKEAFPKRIYGTFSLPSGVYESLRITIGAGEGKNWWCVVFPSLCVGTTGEEYRELAVGAGLSNELISTTMQEDGYEIRFFFLDYLGKLENLFHFR